MQNRVRVLHVIKSLGRGGAEMLLPETLRLHDKEKFDFHYIYFLPWKDQMVESLKQHGGQVVCLSARNNFQLMLKGFQLAKYIRKHKIQVIHAHLPWAGILSRIVGRFTRVPVIYTEHNKQERYHFLTRMMNLATLNWLTMFIAVSKDVEESARKHKPGMTVPARIIQNGVNLEVFRPDREIGSRIRREYSIDGNAIVFGTVAVFRSQKRLDVWLKAAHALYVKHPTTRFLIVGDGPLNNDLRGLADKLGLQGIVHFAGLQTDVRPYFAAMDIFMMSSIFEGLPIALLEAMASGCAILTTDAGGIKEVIRHEQDGLMCGVDESDRLVEFGLELIANPSEIEKYGQQARQRVSDSFGLENMVGELESIYSGQALTTSRLDKKSIL